MLTSDLVLVRSYRKKLLPRYIKVGDPDHRFLAEQLIENFAGHEGHARHQLNAELAEVLGTGTDFQLHRGLAKLLFDRCEFAAESPIEPEELRRQVFNAAAERYLAPTEEGTTRPFDRQDVLEPIAGQLEVELDGLERALYADLKDEQVLSEWRPCTPSWLLRRYNVALAQGVLLRASELQIDLGPQDPKTHRTLFRKIKFFQLMHRVTKRRGGGYRIRLDGPVSVFKASGKYGLQMANFLPTLLHFDDWQLKATVQWGKKRRPMKFELSSDDELQSHTRLTGQWQPEELSWLPEQFAELESDWTLSTDGELIDLGGRGVLVPDFIFTHTNGTRVVMEVFGFWNKGAIDARIDLLRRHGPDNLILGLSSLLATGREKLDELPGEVYTFRTHPIARKVHKVLKSFEP